MSQQALFLYDGSCGICSTFTHWAERRLNSSVRVIPWQGISDLGVYNLTAEDVNTAAYWVEPDGQRLRGHRAIAQVLRAMGGVWWVIGSLIRVPPISLPSRTIYWAVASYRHRLPGGGACPIPQPAGQGAAGRAVRGWPFAWPGRRPLVILVAAWLAVVVPSLILLGPKWLRPGHFGEVFAYLAFALLLASWTPLQDLIRRLPLYRVLLSGAALLLLAGQLLGGGRLLFPLVRFDMFSAAVGGDTLTFMTYEATLASGRRVLIEPADVVPPLDRGRFGSKLRYSLEAAQIGAEPFSPEATATAYSQLLHAIGEAYNRQHRRDPVVAIDVVRHSISHRDFSEPTHVPTWHVDLPR